MKQKYRKLGEYKFSDLIEEVSEKNTDLKYGLNDIIGVTIEKELIPTIANLTQTALDKFYLVKKNTFVYNPRTHGVRLGMGFNEMERTYITSWNNVAFRVKETAKDIVLPKFLWIYFNRSEWDRQSNFLAWGSSTIVFAWNDFLNIKIKLPSVAEQQRIVNAYNTVDRRIRILKQMNEKLEETAQCLFDELYKNNFSLATLSELIDVRDGTHDSPEYVEKGFPLVTSQNLSAFYIDKLNTNKISEEDFHKINERSLVEKNDILISMIGTVGHVSLVTDENIDFAIKNVALLKTSKSIDYRNFILCFLKSKTFTSWLNETLTGSTQQYVSLGEIRNMKIKIASKQLLENFNSKTDKIIESIIKLEREKEKLQNLKQLIISRISGV
ncbi:MAG: restriction endonuclease subunit S [Treponema sp.]